ncbi:hypothetical protein GCM10010199_32610 [Dactylosporangium roseum]
MIGIELRSVGKTGVVFESCKRDGLLVGKGGLYGTTIRMGPPLNLTAEEAREGLEILTNALREHA